MSKRRIAVWALAMLVCVSAIAAAMVPPPAREIVLVARHMAFYLEDDPTTPNPRIEVRAGERVRLVLRNDDRGYTHDVAVPALGAASRLVGWNERGHVVFAAPAAPGAYEYICQPHELMMRGAIEVVPAGSGQDQSVR